MRIIDSIRRRMRKTTPVRRPPVVRTYCNDCGEQDQFHTRTEAFFHMDMHELEHAGVVGCRVYVWQQFCTDNGWVNYRAPAFGNAVN